MKVRMEHVQITVCRVMGPHFLLLINGRLSFSCCYFAVLIALYGSIVISHIPSLDLCVQHPLSSLIFFVGVADRCGVLKCMQR
ncbi:MAG: hypothetical protein J3R72DRAFT_151529 [Linnemannia gamsii]|nr:MAG: hypothetical protein J3R72DRAFT_151529 [Linnemannia gamsii]